MSILQLQRRIAEVGRLRIGEQVTTDNGKTRPAKLQTWRVTSPDRQRVIYVAELYGGQVREWQAPAGRQWEVVTEADSLPVIVPPSDMMFSQHMELWSAGGCQRRCNGVTESISDRPCLCDPEKPACSIHTRLSVMLRDVPGLGIYRLDTQGYYAAVELQGAVEVIQTAAGRGAMLPARLRLEQRTVKRQVNGKPQTRNFAVPVLDIEVTPAQLMGGGAVELGAPTERPALVGPEPDTATEVPEATFTPVPDTVPEGPQQSIAEQSEPPPPPPKRSNSAPEIPTSGRSRRSRAYETTHPPEPPPGDEPPPWEQGDAQPSQDPAPETVMVTKAQLCKLGVIFNQAKISNRQTRLAVTAQLVDRDVTSSSDLTKAEASELIDHLESLGSGGDLAEVVAELLDRPDPAATSDGAA